MFTQLKGLKSVFPSILKISINSFNWSDFHSAYYNSYSDRSNGFHYCVEMTFDNVKSLAEYAVHPKHKQVINDYISPIKDELQVIDFVIRDNGDS